MSLTWKLNNCDQEEIIDFLAAEYVKDSGIPVHLYSIVNATFASYNGALAITDNLKGTMVFESRRILKSYVDNDPIPIVRALRRCRVDINAWSDT